MSIAGSAKDCQNYVSSINYYGYYFFGNKIQMIFDIPIAGSIVGLILFFLLLQFKIIPTKWVEEGSKFFLATMVFFLFHLS